jgi:adenosylhomocysteine nucleosidase
MFQSLVRQWLMRQAQERLKETVKPSTGQTASPSAEKPSAEPAACDVGIVFALSIEAGGLTDRLKGLVSTHGAGFVAREGALAGKRVVIVETGLGSTAATRGTQALIEGHHPRWIISAGFAGGLVESLRARDIFIANQLRSADGQELQLDFRRNESTEASSSSVHVGKLLTVDRIIGRPDEKRQLAQTHGAHAVDMETWSVAQVCQQEKIPLLAVRIISDVVDRKLPRDLQHLAKQKSFAGRFGAVTGAVFRRPSSIKDMWQLREDALGCSDRLAKFLESMIQQLQ